MNTVSSGILSAINSFSSARQGEDASSATVRTNNLARKIFAAIGIIGLALTLYTAFLFTASPAIVIGAFLFSLGIMIAGGIGYWHYSKPQDPPPQESSQRSTPRPSTCQETNNRRSEGSGHSDNRTSYGETCLLNRVRPATPPPIAVAVPILPGATVVPGRRGVTDPLTRVAVLAEQEAMLRDVTAPDIERIRALKDQIQKLEGEEKSRRARKEAINKSLPSKEAVIDAREQVENRSGEELQAELEQRQREQRAPSQGFVQAISRAWNGNDFRRAVERAKFLLETKKRPPEDIAKIESEIASLKEEQSELEEKSQSEKETLQRLQRELQPLQTQQRLYEQRLLLQGQLREAGQTLLNQTLLNRA
ncbi:MAG: hypothetical protein KGI80_01400 [Verrucomicrobiota bacterium]|nr:hypothetical protein [Verrucomicrobiota bacterium]